ncbi:MAG: biotin transporter BioY [bacterium]
MTTLSSLSLARHKVFTQALLISLFVLLTAVGAQLEIPLQPVPMTFQTLVVLLAGVVLGPRYGFLSMVLYLAVGLIGVPVFAHAGFGPARLLGPTGGYLLSFPIAAYIIGTFFSLPLYRSLYSAFARYAFAVVFMVAGMIIIFSAGVVQLNLVYFHDWSKSFQAGFFVFSVWDGLKIVAAATIAHRLK